MNVTDIVRDYIIANTDLHQDVCDRCQENDYPYKTLFRFRNRVHAHATQNDKAVDLENKLSLSLVVWALNEVDWSELHLYFGGKSEKNR